MAKLVYMAVASLDGYIEDEDGKFDWAVPDEEVHTFINDLERPVGTHLLGRRMYDVLVSWETIALAGQPASIRDFAAIWRAADKIVYSKTLEQVSSARTRIERNFDPEAVRELKAAAARDLSIGGPALAARHSRPAWWTRYSCSSRRSWSETASERSPPTSVYSSTCWTIAASGTASFTFTTA